MQNHREILLTVPNDITVTFDHRGMPEPAPVICKCAIIENRIRFCAFHDSAQRLLTTCELVRKFLGNLTLPRESQSVIEELLLPYIDAEIMAARQTS